MYLFAKNGKSKVVMLCQTNTASSRITASSSVSKTFSSSLKNDFIFKFHSLSTTHTDTQIILENSGNNQR